MTIDMENLVESIMESLERIPDIPLSDIPGIDLYMDQLTTFMPNFASLSLAISFPVRVSLGVGWRIS